MASRDITYCNNRKCEKIDCRRHYTNAPFDMILSWFHVTPDEKSGKCNEYWPYENIKKGKKTNASK
jgi:hypothetical protein